MDSSATASPGNASPGNPVRNAPPDRELVLLTHGIASTKWTMVPLAKRLQQRGFATQLWGYSSLRRPIEHHGRVLANKLRLLMGSGKWNRIHLAVHSMGSIVTRCALYELDAQVHIEEHRPEKLGRVVMFGPPNGGSHRATLLAPFYGWFSRSLTQLRDTPDSFVNRLPALPDWAEIGVLAAARDNVIHLDKTHVGGERDHHVVDSWHTGMLWKQETANLTANFLMQGRFRPQPAVDLHQEPDTPESQQPLLTSKA